MERWYMQDETSINFDTGGTKFVLLNGEDRKLFEISRNALVDYFETPDTREDANHNFENYRDRICALALRLIDEQPEDASYMILLEDCRRFQL